VVKIDPTIIASAAQHVTSARTITERVESQLHVVPHKSEVARAELSEAIEQAKAAASLLDFSRPSALYSRVYMGKLGVQAAQFVVEKQSELRPESLAEIGRHLGAMRQADVSFRIAREPIDYTAARKRAVELVERNPNPTGDELRTFIALVSGDASPRSYLSDSDYSLLGHLEGIAEAGTEHSRPEYPLWLEGFAATERALEQFSKIPDEATASARLTEIVRLSQSRTDQYLARLILHKYPAASIANDPLATLEYLISVGGQARKSLPAIERHLNTIWTEHLALSRSADPTVADLAKSVVRLAEINTSRIRNVGPSDGYENFPDYGELGELITAAKMLSALTDTAGSGSKVSW
jgi:hypothetical protein